MYADPRRDLCVVSFPPSQGRGYVTHHPSSLHCAYPSALRASGDSGSVCSLRHESPARYKARFLVLRKAEPASAGYRKLPFCPASNSGLTDPVGHSVTQVSIALQQYLKGAERPSSASLPALRTKPLPRSPTLFNSGRLRL